MMGLCVTFPKIDSLVRGIFKSVGSKGEVKFYAGRQKWKVNSVGNVTSFAAGRNQKSWRWIPHQTAKNHTKKSKVWRT
jgi:hypothetical protein